MFITELSIKRPTVSWVMSLILIIFGLFVFWKLPVRELPNGIQPPVVQVQVDYKSAAAAIVDQEVTHVKTVVKLVVGMIIKDKNVFRIRGQERVVKAGVNGEEARYPPCSMRRRWMRCNKRSSTMERTLICRTSTGIPR